MRAPLLTAAIGATLALAPAANAQTFAGSCNLAGCHNVGEPVARRLNATGPVGTNADSQTVIWAASVVNGMGFNASGGANLSTVISDLRAAAATPADTPTVNYTSPFTATTSVPYGGTRLVTLPNLEVGNTSSIITSASHSPAVTGVSFTGNVLTFNHPGGATGNCSTRTVNAFGTGPTRGAGADQVTPRTANRVITITVTPPAAPGTNDRTTNIDWSLSATDINLAGILGAITGTPVDPSTTVSLGALNPNIGTRTAVNETTLRYTANANTYAPQVVVPFAVTGPCGQTSGFSNLTINVNNPPPPTVLNYGSAGTPIVVPAGTPTLIDLFALGRITGLRAHVDGTVYSVTPTQPTGGAGTTTAAGDVVTFTPNGGFTGPTSFTFTRSGPGGNSASATVFLNVTAAPITSSPPTVVTAFNTPVTVNLATACGGSSCIVSSTAVLSVTPSSPANGTAIATGPTSIQFTPTAGYFGPASFSYTATNAGGTSSPPTTVNITVNPPPPTVSTGTATAAFNPGTPVIATTIDLAPFIGPPGAAVLSVAPTAGTNGTVVATGPTTVSFTPTAGFIGPATFTFTATNVAGTSATSATVNVTVNPPAPPVTAAQTFLVSASAPTTFDLAPGVSGIFTPPLQVVTQPAGGTVAINGTRATYTPQPGFTGTMTFTYRAVGPGGPSTPGTVTLRYVQVAVASNITASTPLNTAVRIDLIDAFAGFVETYRISRLPANGTATISGQFVTYTPNAGFIGTDTFEFTGTGPGGTSNAATATINVLPPIAVVNGLNVSTPFNTPVTIDLNTAITGFASSFSLAGGPGNGTVVIAGSMATYTPSNGFSGADSFRIVAVNASGTSEPGTITVTVGSLAPTGSAATMRVAVNGKGTLDLAPFITGSGITGITISSLPNHGIADVDGTKVIYTPRTGFFGTDSFEYVAFGNAGRSPPVKILVVIEGRPDPSQDKNVRAIVDNQAQAARRFSRAQITNFQRRMETLHVPGPVTPSAAPDAEPGDAKKPAAAAKVPATGFATGFVPPPAALPGSPARNAPGTMESTFATGLASLVAGRSLNLSASSDGGRPAGMMGGINFWVGGTASFGTRSLGDDEGPYRFSTDGLSLGADRRIDDRLAVGLGIGYARDRSDLGDDGTKNKSRGASFAGYASYHPTPSTYLDALAGFGKLTFDADRYVEAFDESLSANRDGDQFFASIAGGYEYRVRNFLIAPYGRLDVTVDRLKAVTEGGQSVAALTYEEQTLRTTSAAAGLRLESTHETDYGRVVPRARIEYRHDFEGGRTAGISYADLFGGLTYSVSPAGTSKNAFLLGIGSDFLLSSGWKIGVDYQGERTSGPGTVQSVRFLVSKDLDGKGLPSWSGWTMPLKIPVNVDFGMVWDDNIARGRLDEEIVSDRIYTLNVGRTYDFPINKNVRALATAIFTVDKPHDVTGLGHFALGAQGELQYRASGDFDAVTYAIYARGLYDQFESNLRTGARYSFGANLRRAITDRIDLFADLSHHRRYGRSAVFETKETAGRVNLDYSLGRNGTLYLSGEYRKGDIFSSGFASLTNIAIADVAVRDDAFDGAEVFAYRFDGKTVLGTFGYNRPLGPRDAIDFSVRRVQSTPSSRPDFDEGGRLRYIVNQYSLLYLLRF